jgi:sulfur-carrier protein
MRQVLQGGEDLLRPPGPAGQAGELGHPIPSEADVPAAAAILDGLGERFGDRFAAVLGYSSVLVDGERWRDPAAPVPDGAELALLPPFSGGA